MEKYKKPYKDNKFKISAPSCNKEIEVPDELCSIFRYSRLYWIHGEKTVNPSIRIYMNKIENRITFKIKAVLSFNSWNNEFTWKHYQ